MLSLWNYSRCKVPPAHTIKFQDRSTNRHVPRLVLSCGTRER